VLKIKNIQPLYGPSERVPLHTARTKRAVRTARSNG